MGTFTPNIGLFIPAAGETNYTDVFAAGMINLDQHDHSGGPNKGLPISTTGLADFSVTFNKLNSNVADTTTGIGVDSTPGLQNQLQLLGVLRNLYTFANAAGTGFISINGSTVAGRTFQNSSTVTWTNADGIAGNPSAAFNIAGISPVGVANGGTGVTSFNAWDIICGGATSTGPLQQVSGEGTIGQLLTSRGAGTIPSWQDAVPQLQQASVTLTAAQFNALNVTAIQLVATPGPGKVIVPVQCFALLNFVAQFTVSSGVLIGYGTPTPLGSLILAFSSTAFSGTSSAYYNSSTLGPNGGNGNIQTNAQNMPLYLLNTNSASGGTGSTITFVLSYYVLTL